MDHTTPPTYQDTSARQQPHTCLRLISTSLSTPTPKPPATEVFSGKRAGDTPPRCDSVGPTPRTLPLRRSTVFKVSNVDLTERVSTNPPVFFAETPHFVIVEEKEHGGARRSRRRKHRRTDTPSLVNSTCGRMDPDVKVTVGNERGPSVERERRREG